MHGRVRATAPPTAAEDTALKKKAAAYSELSRVLLQRRKQADTSAETFELIAKMLRTNPDFYTLWNYRKEIVISRCASENIPLAEAMAPTRAGIPSCKVPLAIGCSMLQVELGLSEECIKKNPKSYGAWYHRKWLITYFEFDSKVELDLCALLLSSDQRNFHCWNYRRFVADITNTSPQSEFEFSTKKLNENFSNYSAFHHRSVYITRLALTMSSFQHLISTELSLVENAIYTEPDDQSAWWYRQFILKWMNGGHNGAVDLLWTRRILKQQAEVLDGLLEIEVSCRWAVEGMLENLRLLAQYSEDEEEIRQLKGRHVHFLKMLEE